jgi:hypothetical protein
MAGARVSLVRRSRPQAVSCRAATLNDYEQIQTLKERNGLKARSYPEWSHLWVDNPACKRMPDLAIGWVLEDAAGRIVGTLGSIPFLFELEGRELAAGTSHAWVVDAPYRSYAPMLLDLFLSQPGADLHLALYPNSQSIAAIELHCQRVPVGLWDEYAFWITSYRPFVARYLAFRHYPLAKPLSYPLSWGVQLWERLTKEAVRPGDADVRACSGFDERFDEFWAGQQRANPHRLLAVRTREVLEWHYKYPLLYGQLWIATVVEGSRIVAYAMFSRRDSTAMQLVDFQSLDGTTALLPPLLHWAAKRCEAEGIVTLMAIGRWLDKGELLDRIAPHRRRLPYWIYFAHATDPALAARLRDRSVWAPTLFDGDAVLMHRIGIGADHPLRDEGAASD